MTENRETTTRNVAWFLDLRRRAGGLDLDPPYQRRSVWNQGFRDYFIDTILLNLPVPAIFLFESISEEGSLSYAVVDGKQRLTAIFDFVDDIYPVSDRSKLERFRGKYFSSFTSAEKQELVYTYLVPVEILPSTDEGSLDEIFDRINRNVSRLTPQELRHARFYGDFATTVEQLASEAYAVLPERFPNIAVSSRRQMKDVEFVALLVLLVESGPESTPQYVLDAVYAERDEEWESKKTTVSAFRKVVKYVKQLAEAHNNALQYTRLRNQGDFYALFGAVEVALAAGDRLEPDVAAERLRTFIEKVSEEAPQSSDARRYYDAARSAANDPRQRATRIAILRRVITQG